MPSSTGREEDSTNQDMFLQILILAQQLIKLIK